MHQLELNPLLRDEHYISTIRNGGGNGEQAILDLYTLYHKPVWKAISDLIKLYPGCRTTTEDVIHDAFLVMIYKIQSDHVSTKSLKAFWIGISRRVILNQVKKQKKITLVEEMEEEYGSPEISPEELFMITERNQQIEIVISKSGQRCKQILLLWMAHYTMDEIAQQLHLSSAAMARKIKCSCFKKLKILIERDHIFDY